MSSTPTRFLFASYLLLAMPALAQEKPTAPQRPDLVKGKVIASVQSLAKPEQRYALYVPTNYVSDRTWPIIYAFDPGANGTRPLELMKEAAETYGYIVAGSNNSRNGPWEAERDAAQAVWNDTHQWISIDDRRVYFAGFSGGARLSAQLAQMCNCAHGVFLGGAGFPPSMPPSRTTVFAVFSTVGMSDFNYGEVTELDAQFETLGFRHFLQRFEGAHSWAPADVWRQAMAWATLLEMKDNLRDTDKKLVSTELTRATDRLRKREEAGEISFAWGETRSTIAAFDGLADTSALKKQLSDLERNPAVRSGAKREKADIERQHSLEGDILRIIQSLGEGGGDQASMVGDASNRIRGLVEDARREKRPEEKRVLERALGSVFVYAMETGSPILEKGDAHSAIPYFELATIAHPDWSWPHFSLAKCHALSGDKKAALRDLEHAREDGATAAEVAEFVRRSPQLAFLADTPEYQKLLAIP